MPNIIKISMFVSLASWQWTFAQPVGGSETTHNNLLYAVAWKQTAAEYRALYHQGFNMARLHVENALANHAGEGRPLAVIADVDDTLLLSTPYWGYLVSEGTDFFDDDAWDNWIRENRTEASPGARSFLQYCFENDVEVFYVTSRDQGDDTFELALNNLVSAGFPNADAGHLTVLRESSNKEVVQARIRENHNVIVMLGDNLNDFARRYYVTDVNERSALMEQDQALFGMQYILFPNPTDGHWIRAIFGESEPLPSKENRQTLREAASRDTWQSR